VSEELNLVTTFANCIMAAGALLIVLQIWQAKKQAVTSFEDSLNAEYRRIIHAIPVKATFGEPFTAEEIAKYIDEFLFYFDLCNQQAFLRKEERIQNKIWEFWSEGMRLNFNLPAFKQAWGEVETRTPKTFYSELRRLVVSDFRQDPKSCK